MEALIDKSCPDLIKNHVIIHSNSSGDDLYACTLNQADVKNNCNKFCILQLLKRTDGKSYFIISRAGRVGYNGVENIDCCLLEDQAIKEFKREFYDRTGFNWDDRDTAVRKTGKYDYIQMRYENPDANKVGEMFEMAAKHVVLDKHVTKLIQMIFDKKTFDAVAEQYNLDTKRAPLGAISSAQIKKAYNILKNISEGIDKLTDDEFTDLSSQFYTVIPTNFGMGPPPILKTQAMVLEKVELLRILGDVEVMSKLIKKTQESKHLLESQYLSLNTEIKRLNDSDRRSLISKYLQDSSGHHYKLRIKEVYEVRREEEYNMFKKWENHHNRQLLWHGSGVANYVSILSTGLRINPGNVVKTGSMFGNGLYFANSSTKAAQYMRTTTTGIMLLCEVALGTCYKLTAAKYITRGTLPDSYHSTHGVGRHRPAQSGYQTVEGGLIVPAGKLEKDSAYQGSLNYDEFIVYDQTQLRIRYLFILDV